MILSWVNGLKSSGNHTILFADITTFNTHYIMPVLVSYLRSLVVRALHRRRKGVGSILAGGPIVDDVFRNCSWLEFRHVYDFHSN